MIYHRKRKGRSLYNRGCNQSLIRKYILMNGNRYFKWLSGIENFKAIEAAPQIMTHRILVSLRCKKVENGREAVALCNNDVAGDFAVLH